MGTNAHPRQKGYGRMSKYTLKAAIKYGDNLREFSNISQAENYFIAHKDSLLNRLRSASTQSSVFFPDYTVESLKRIEQWYFDLYEENAFGKIGLSQKEFECMMSVYWGEVIIKNHGDAKWIVEEYPFVQGKYELLVNKGLINVSIGEHFCDLYKRPNNKRKNILFREYNKYFTANL